MMRPLALYLAEFRPDPPAGPPAPFVAAPPPEAGHAVDDLALLPAMAEEPGAVPPDVAPFPAFGGVEVEVETVAAPIPDLDAALAAQRAEHEASLLAARAQWAATEGTVLAQQLAEGLAALETRLADGLALVLQPLLSRAAQARALAGLRDMLGTLLRGDEARALLVSGPADLLAALRDSHGDRPGLSFTEADTPDVTVVSGDTRIRSQLRAWTRTLDLALEAPGARQ